MNFRAFLIGGVSMFCGLGMAITIMGQTPVQKLQAIPDETGQTKRELPQEPARAAADNAMRDAEAAEASYLFALESNRKQSGTVSDEEIERLHRIYADSQLSASSKQIKLLRAEVDQLRAQVQELGTVKIKPVGLK